MFLNFKTNFIRMKKYSEHGETLIAESQYCFTLFEDKNKNHLFSEPFSVTVEDSKYTVQLELDQPAVLTRAKRCPEGAAHSLVL